MDAADLSRLLNESFRLWRVDARAQACPAPVLGAEVRSASRPPMRIRRRAQGKRGLPAWRFEPGRGESVELPALAAVLGRLRSELDPDYVPRRAIIGVRPPQDPPA